jgi:hypothetical protein
MTDSGCLGILAGVAFLGLFALFGFVIYFAVTVHAWGLLAVESGLLLALLVFMLCAGRERRPRERREVQKGARWP